MAPRTRAPALGLALVLLLSACTHEPDGSTAHDCPTTPSDARFRVSSLNLSTGSVLAGRDEPYRYHVVPVPAPVAQLPPVRTRYESRDRKLIVHPLHRRSWGKFYVPKPPLTELAGTLVYRAQTGDLRGADVLTGRARWSLSAQGILHATILERRGNHLLLLGEGPQRHGLLGTGPMAGKAIFLHLDARTGRIMWRYEVKAARRAVVRLSQGLLVFAVAGGDYVGPHATVGALDLSSGARRWQREVLPFPDVVDMTTRGSVVTVTTTKALPVCY